METKINMKKLYRQLAVLSDKGIAAFERCCLGPVVFEDHDELNTGYYLREQNIATIGPLGEICVSQEYSQMYNEGIKSELFEAYRKRASWVHRCTTWCDYMYTYFHKSMLLKLINMNMKMDENEMIDIFRKFPRGISTREYGDWFIPDINESDYEEIMDNIEKQKTADYYIPTVNEIDEYYHKGFLFSKDYAQNLYNFLINVSSNEDEVYGICFDCWFEFQLGKDIDFMMDEIFRFYPMLKKEKDKVHEL